MRKSTAFVALSLVIFAPLAVAYEYPLQFTPNAGYRGLVIAGYWFSGTDVVGNCSYYTVSAGSGKGGGSSVKKTYEQTCTWDQFGNFVSVAPGAPAVPEALSVSDTHVIYAENGNESTGTDTKVPGRGFVNTPGTHYTWLTPNNNAVIHQSVYTFVATLKSDGDGPVTISDVQPSALNGKVTLKKTTCSGEIKVGGSCSMTITYDPTLLTSDTGLAYDKLRIDLTSDAGEAHDFIQNYTIVLPQKLD